MKRSVGVRENQCAKLSERQGRNHGLVDEPVERGEAVQRVDECRPHVLCAWLVAVAQERADGFRLLRRIGRIKSGEVQIGQCLCVGLRTDPFRRSHCEIAAHWNKCLLRRAAELRTESAGLGLSLPTKACGGTYDLKAVRANAQALSKPAKQKAHFRSLRTSIQVSFIEDDQDSFIGTLPQPLPGLVEDRPLNWPHHHVLKHRVVRNEQIRRARLHFVTGQQLCIVCTKYRALVASLTIAPG